jgi:hypothetical protein
MPVSTTPKRATDDEWADAAQQQAIAVNAAIWFFMTSLIFGDEQVSLLETYADQLNSGSDD